MVVPAIVVHGGAGRVSELRHERLRLGCAKAAENGNAILEAGGSALDAVVAAVRILEDDPEYNAGTGSVLTRDGTIETDACVMDGASLRIGGVAAVPDLGCAIAVARAVLDDGEHVLLAGSAAWQFATERGFTPAIPGSLITERSKARWSDESARRTALSEDRTIMVDRGPDERPGNTVGAVARDREGRLAAATSTGGINFKRPGRVGDSPIPGAGTWADRHAAISATGDGEAIMRVALARGIAARLALRPDRSTAAIDTAVHDALDELVDATGGEAGVIAICADGISIGQLTETMAVAWVEGGKRGDSMGRRISR